MATRTDRNARPAVRPPAFPLPKIHPAGWYKGGDLRSAPRDVDTDNDAINVSTVDHERIKPFGVVSVFARLFAQAVADAERRGWLVEPEGPRLCPPMRGGKHARAS